MKRILLIFLAQVLIFTAACSGEYPAGPKDNDSGNETESGVLLDYDTYGRAAQYVHTGGDYESTEYPLVTVIRSKSELNDYYTANRRIFELDRAADTSVSGAVSFVDACDRYDETYFENQVLVLVLVWEPSCSIAHKVTNVGMSQDGRLIINIDRLVPEMCDTAEAKWHIFVEPAPGINVDASQVTIGLYKQTATRSEHTHTEASTPQTVSEPFVGYCGNTVTTVHDGDKNYSFWGGDSVYVTDLLLNLDYDPQKVCKCLPEYTVDTEFGLGYGINLTDGYARCDKGQADLTKEQVEELKEIIYNISKE